MKIFVQPLLSSLQFIPHGHCYLWRPQLVSLHLISDVLIAIAYYSIPITLLYFVQKRRNTPFNGVFLLFSAFIVACGTTHLLEVWTLWHPDYWLSGALKLITALVSLYTAFRLVSLLPRALALSDLAAANRELAAEIAERQKTEMALRESEERFRNTFEQAAMGIAHVSSDGRFLRLNQRFCAIAGYSLSELQTLSFQEITHPDDLESDLSRVHDLLNGRIQTYSLEKRYIRKDQSLVWVNLTVSLVRNTSGEPEYFIAVIEDISDRVRVEQALRQSEATLRLFIKYAPSGIAMLDADLHYVFASQRWVEDYSPVPVESLLGRCLYDVFPNLPDRWRQVHQRCLAGAIERCEEDIFERTDGSQQWIRWEVRPWYTEDQDIGGIIIFSEGIGARKQAEAERLRAEKLRLELQLLENILEVAFAGYWDWNIPANEEYLSPTFKRMFGYEDHELPNQPDTWQRLIFAEDLPGVLECFNQHVRSRGQIPYYNEVRYRHKDGSTVWVICSGRVIEWDAAGNPLRMVGCHFDITKRKRAETQLQASEAELQALFAAMADTVVVRDREGRCLKIAPNSQRLYAASGEILGRTLHETLPEPEADLILANIRECLDRQTTISVEYSLRIDGEPVYFLTSISPLSEATVLIVARDISDRKQSEQTLQGLSTAMQNAIEGIARIDGNERYLTVNRSYASMCGYEPEELVGQSRYLTVHPDDLPQMMAAYQRMRRCGRAEVEARGMHKDGSIFYKQVTLVAAYQDDEMVGHYCFTKDISDRKRAEAKLQQAYDELSQQAVQMGQVNQVLQSTLAELQVAEEELQLQNAQLAIAQTLADAERCRYQDLFDFAPDGYVVTDQYGNIQEANQAIADLVGTKRDRLVNTPLRTYILDLDREIFRNLLGEFNRHPQPPKLQTDALRLQPRKGKPLPISVTVVATHNLENKVVSMRWLIQDITERKQAEAVLANYTREVEDLYNNAPCGYHSLDADGRFIKINNTELDWLGYTDDEIIGRPFTHFLTESSRTVFEQNYPKFKAQGWVKDLEFDLICKDGTLFQGLLNATAVKSADGSYLHSRSTLFDMRDRKQAEDQLRLSSERLSLANAELARAARLKDEFLAGMSHELRTPLNAILGLSEALLEGVHGSLNSEQQEFLQTIEKSGQHLLSLINDILDLSKIESGKMELELAPVPVRSLCESSLAFVKQQANYKQIKLSCQLAEGVTSMEADERRLRQVLVNLLSNAVKFTPDRGSVQLQVTVDPQRQMLEFHVTDTGIGIAPENIHRLFQPFVQLDSRLSRRYEGSGLGLALVRRILDLHGGTVSVESVVGEGSCFTVALPWKPSPGSADFDSQGALLEPSSLNLQQVLIIEDSEAAASQIVRYLTPWGARAIVHTQGAGALEAAVAAQPDVIILDILLPDRTGWEVLVELKAKPATRHIPVVVVSVVDSRSRGLELGADEYLVKPFTRQQLEQTLSRVLSAVPASESAPILSQNPSPVLPRILLAEDNEANIATIALYLQAHGVQVITAQNGLEAIQMAHEYRPDLILMDVQMPELDGLEATRRIRLDGELSQIPIIALTALAMPGDRDRCLTAGATEYLTKPVSLKQLLTLISTYVPTLRTGE